MASADPCSTQPTKAASENALNNLKIGARLALAFATIVVLAVVVGAIGVSRLGTLNDDLGTIGADRVPKVQTLAAVTDDVNLTDTRYFANNNARHFAFNADERFLPIYQYADEANKKFTHLDSFAETFLAKCTLGEAISRYMVLVASEQKLLMMRPYQMSAVKAIVECIRQNCGNGYIWHTTGSGKTLTSFKAAILPREKLQAFGGVYVGTAKRLKDQ